MPKSQSIRIRYFVWLGYVIPIFLSVLSALGAWSQSNLVRGNSKELERSLRVGEYIGDVSFNIQTTSRATRGYLLDPSPVSISSFDKASEEVDKAFVSLDEYIKDEKQKKLLTDIKNVYNKLKITNQGLLDLAENGKVAQAISQWKVEGARGEAEQLTQLLSDFRQNQTDINAFNQGELDKALTRLNYLVFSLTITSIVVALIFGWWIIGWITNRLTQTTVALASSSNEIVTTVEEQERIASQQAASVNETSTTMEELGISSRQSAEQAQAAAQAATQVLTLAESGQQTVLITLNGMDALRLKVQAIAAEIVRLNEQTNQIGHISQLVSDLANQTNMLALNAAVEAVRAGEHGKGFSVVASEIRKLADQSRQSAGQISSLVGNIQQAIQSTVGATEEGTQTVESNMMAAQRTAEAFTGVTAAINEVVENNQQISLNIQQQASAIQQVVTAMTNLNQGAKESAIGIGQTRLSTQALNEATQQLQTLF